MKSDVIKFEKILNESETLFNDLSKVLERVRKNQKKFNELKKYYGSDEYDNDVKISNDTNEYDDIACGVLSEDGAYNVFASSYSAALEMLELATEILKNS